MGASSRADRGAFLIVSFARGFAALVDEMWPRPRERVLWLPLTEPSGDIACVEVKSCASFPLRGQGSFQFYNHD